MNHTTNHAPSQPSVSLELSFFGNIRYNQIEVCVIDKLSDLKEVCFSWFYRSQPHHLLYKKVVNSNAPGVITIPGA
jgi:hypothetical protein